MYRAASPVSSEFGAVSRTPAPGCPLCYPRPLPPTDSFSLFFGQEEADTAERDAGRLWRRYLPGDCHHSHGDAQNPAAGCRPNWYVGFTSLCAEQAGEEGWSWNVGAELEGKGREDTFPSLCCPKSEVSQVAAEVSPPLPSSVPPPGAHLALQSFSQVRKVMVLFAPSNRLGK